MALLCLLGIPIYALQAAHLQQETIAAFDRYIQSAEAGMEARNRQHGNFLWIDESPERRRKVQGGQIWVQPAAGDGQVHAAGGLIHDWIGAVFVPGAGIRDLFAVVQDYDNYKNVYKPGVLDSELIDHRDDEYTFRVRLAKRTIITMVIDVEEVSRYIPLSPTRWYSRAWSIRILEVQNAGSPNERRLPPAQGRGILWRLYAYSRFLERDGGVYVELEPIALSRSIPAVLQWLIDPIVRKVSRDSLFLSLKSTRDAVLRRRNMTARERTPGALGAALRLEPVPAMRRAPGTAQFPALGGAGSIRPLPGMR
jgi:hypothetical protein